MQIQPRPFGAVLGEAMTGLGRIWRPLLSTSLIVFIPLGVATLAVFNWSGALSFIDTVLNDPGALEGMGRAEFFELAVPFLWALAIAIALQSIASVYVYLATHRLVAGDLAGDPPGGPRARREAARRFPAALVAVLIVLVAVVLLFGLGLALWAIPFFVVGTPNAASVLVALVLLIAVAAPAIWLSVSFSMVTSVVAIEERGPIAALVRSFSLVKPRWWPTFGYLALVGLLGSVAAQLIQVLAVPLTVIGDPASGLTLASLLGVVVQGMIVAGIAVMVTHWYVDLRSRLEDVTAEDLAPGAEEPAGH